MRSLLLLNICVSGVDVIDATLKADEKEQMLKRESISLDYVVEFDMFEESFCM